MSDKSGVSIEPPTQTRLLDFCSTCPGVVGGVVPGAGGYDAVALLVENDDELLAELSRQLAGWRSIAEEKSNVSIGKVSLLGVRQDTRGSDWKRQKHIMAGFEACC
jgi:phosphomevalonate kinase